MWIVIYVLILYLFIILVTNDLIGASKPGRSIILTINEKKIKKTLTLQSHYVHETTTSCAGRTNNEKIMFKFMCGFELQKPIKIKNDENNKSCITNVLNIDPEMCSKKVCIFSQFYLLILFY